MMTYYINATSLPITKTQIFQSFRQVILRNKTTVPYFKMASSGALYVALFISTIACHSAVVNAMFTDSMYINWGAHHSWMHSDDLQLVLDQSSGKLSSSFLILFSDNGCTNLDYSMRYLLSPGHSAGTVTAYYLSSPISTINDKHDEIDFEFLGNVSGQPYTIHTNIFTQGVGGREQQFHPWFDPTADYHNYTIHWNPTAVVWYIDDIPIRVFRNYQNQGIAYPNAQAMGVYSSLWNADDWATRGGLDKIDWNSAPFVAQYRNFRARACYWNGPVSISQCAVPSPANWYTSPQYGQLSYDKQGQMNWVRNNYMIYDYCKDAKRFNGQFPSECFKPHY